MIKAVVFDLDDTLFSELDYVRSGYRVVEKEIEKRYSLLNAYDELLQLFQENHQLVFNRFLVRHGVFNEQDVSWLVDLYRNHNPNISLSVETKETLLKLRGKGYRLGVITDGRPSGQRKKIDALCLDSLVDKIIITDELGGTEYRKPNPKSFEIMCAEFNISPNEMVYVGDNPQKDFAIKKILPVKTILFSSGLYQDEDFRDGILPDENIKCLADLFKAKILGTNN